MSELKGDCGVLVVDQLFRLDAHRSGARVTCMLEEIGQAHVSKRYQPWIGKYQPGVGFPESAVLHHLWRGHRIVYHEMALYALFLYLGLKYENWICSTSFVCLIKMQNTIDIIRDTNTPLIFRD